MAKGLAGLIAVLGAGMGGYAKGNLIHQDEQRRQRREAREEEEYQHTKTQRDKAARLERDLAASQQDVSPEAVTNTGATYADESLIAADNRENRRNAEQVGMPAPVPMAPASYTANGQTFADRAGAQQALAGVNSQAAKMERAAKVYGQAGQLDKQREYMAYADKMYKEGADDIISEIMGKAPSIDAIKKAKGTLDGTIPSNAIETFNKKGGMRIGDASDSKVQWFIEKDAAGREVANFRIYGKNGMPVLENGRAAQLMLMDAKTRLDQQNQDTQAFQRKQTIDNADRHARATEANAAAQLGIARERLSMDKESFKKQTLAGQIDQYETALGRKLEKTERESIISALSGIGKKSGADDGYQKLVDKVIETEVQTGALKSTDVPGRRAELLAAPQIAQAMAEVKPVFANLKNGTPEYAAAYAEALQSIPSDRLASWGIAPPQKVRTAVPAAFGVKPTQATPIVTNKIAANRERIRQEQESAVSQVRTSFDTDMQSLPPLELVRKYDRLRSSLTTDQKVALSKAERSM